MLYAAILVVVVAQTILVLHLAFKVNRLEHHSLTLYEKMIEMSNNQRAQAKLIRIMTQAIPKQNGE